MRLILYTQDDCGECERVKAALGCLLAACEERAASSLFDEETDADVVSGILAAARGQLPLLRVGPFIFSIAGEFPHA